MTADLLATLPGLLDVWRRLAVATIVSAKGSTPRAAGARMLILPDGSTRSTIGDKVLFPSATRKIPSKQ